MPRCDLNPCWVAKDWDLWRTTELICTKTLIFCKRFNSKCLKTWRHWHLYFFPAELQQVPVRLQGWPRPRWSREGQGGQRSQLPGMTLNSVVQGLPIFPRCMGSPILISSDFVDQTLYTFIIQLPWLYFKLTWVYCYSFLLAPSLSRPICSYVARRQSVPRHKLL